MTNYLSTPPSATDSERAAGWAAQALQEGRLELALTLTRVAISAEAVERANSAAAADQPVTRAGAALRSVPTGDTAQRPAVYEQLSQLGLMPSPATPIVPGPTGNADRDLARETTILDAIGVRAAVNEAAGRVHRPEPVPPSRRCDARVHRDGITDSCREVAYLSPDGGGWRHLNPETETDHAAIIDDSGVR